MGCGESECISMITVDVGSIANPEPRLCYFAAIYSSTARTVKDKRTQIYRRLRWPLHLPSQSQLTCMKNIFAQAYEDNSPPQIPTYT